jgi:hypothetical protein
MTLRTALAAGLLLALVSAAWWLLGVYAAEPEAASGALAAPAEQTSAETGLTPDADLYPQGYVDNLPLGDAPAIPADVANDYVPTFEPPDLFGDGMPVPLEFEIDESVVLPSEEEAP